MGHHHRLLILLTLALAVFPGPARAADPPDEPTLDVGLVERTERTLSQIDVTVEGPPEVVVSLTAADFEIKVGGRKLRDVTLDRLCAIDSEPPPVDPDDSGDSGVSVAEAAPPSLVNGAVSYLFYFDQHHLTFAGRRRSLELARELVDELIREGSTASIVSSGRTMRTFTRPTADRELLLQALDELEDDPEQWDTFPMEEDHRVNMVQWVMESYLEAAQLSSTHMRRSLLFQSNRGYPGRSFGAMTAQENELATLGITRNMDQAVGSARSVARGYQREEWWHTQRALGRFSTVLGRMALYDSPKAVVYFGDTVRINAGAHYLGLVGDGTMALPEPAGLSTDSTVPSFDWVIEEAGAHDVRLYTVQAEGLVARTPQSWIRGTRSMFFAPTSPGAAGQRFIDARSSLVTLAAETGGRSFLRGVSASRIARGIRGDMDCLYLISFDPTGLPRNSPLRVVVKTTRPQVKVRARGQTIIRTESAHRTSLLMTAFDVPGEVRGETPITSLMIPTGFEKGKFTGMLQVIIPGSARDRADWEVGASIVSRGRVRENASGRITVEGRDLPVIFESEVRLRPGPWEMTSVAHEVETGEILAGRVSGDWPDPRDQRATVGPISLLQPVVAAFVRDDAVRRQGSLGRVSEETIRTDLPTALVGIVCRQRRHTGKLYVERRLVGENTLEFPRIELPYDVDRCSVVSDVIPAGTMTAGRFEYELRVRSAEEDVATASRHLAALDP